MSQHTWARSTFGSIIVIYGRRWGAGARAFKFEMDFDTCQWSYHQIKADGT